MIVRTWLRRRILAVASLKVELRDLTQRHLHVRVAPRVHVEVVHVGQALALARAQAQRDRQLVIAFLQRADLAPASAVPVELPMSWLRDAGRAGAIRIDAEGDA